MWLSPGCCKVKPVLIPIRSPCWLPFCVPCPCCDHDDDEHIKPFGTGESQDFDLVESFSLLQEPASKRLFDNGNPCCSPKKGGGWTQTGLREDLEISSAERCRRPRAPGRRAISRAWGVCLGSRLLVINQVTGDGSDRLVDGCCTVMFCPEVLIGINREIHCK